MNFELTINSQDKITQIEKIEFLRNGIMESKTFGYYTNGYPIDESYKIIILDQEVEIIKES